MAASKKLPVLALPHPLILFPHSRLSLPVTKDLGQALLTLIQESDVQPTIVATPTLFIQDNGKPARSELNEWGTAARIVRLARSPTLNASPDLPYVLTMAGLARFRLVSPADAVVSYDSLVYHPVESPKVDESLTREAVDAFKAAAAKLLDRLAKDARQTSKKDFWNRLASMLDDTSDGRTPWLADTLISSINVDFQDKLDFLQAVSAMQRLEDATKLFIKQASISEVTTKINSAVESTLENQQKEFFLRQQLAAITRELHSLQNRNYNHPNAANTNPADGGESGGQKSELDDEEANEAEEMGEVKRKIGAMVEGSEERKMAVREWRRMKRLQQGSVEYGVLRSYLEWLTALPWPTNAPSPSSAETLEALRDRSFLSKAQAQLDADHFGLDKIKRRLIEYLAILRLKEINSVVEREKDAQALVPVPSPNAEGKSAAPIPSPAPKRRTGVKGPILLFVGPPGCGKTSLGQSVARALNRPFQRLSLGGVRDEAEIRGHRRTYVASGPGSIVQAMRKAGRPDPVFLLDEIDKIGHSNFHGDPAAALLEVLDPEQNHTFTDHYINVPLDLSQVLFICTANTLDTLSPPLLDRCEIIQLSGYTFDEKQAIARRFLVPKQLDANGLNPDLFTLTDDALVHIATRYTREAGVRSMERSIGAVVRRKAVEWSEADGDKSKEYEKEVKAADLEAILGVPRWEPEEKEREERRGMVYGLVVMGEGEGGILPVETLALPGTGRLKLTGSLGQVIKESGELALSWVKMHSFALRITTTPAQDPLKVPEPIDIHLHLPAGAQKKDGPSAGVAMTCAFVSLLTGACVPSNVAMTGEITLRGRVTAVGGIKEKILGAHRAKITKVLVPYANRKDVEHDVNREIRDQMEIVFVRTVDEALEAAFGKSKLNWRVRPPVLVESRL